MSLALAHPLALALALAFVAQPELPGPQSVQLPGRVAVPMNMDLVKPSIQVTIDGHGPYRFLFDTGASPALVVNDDLVEELNLPVTGGGRIGDPTNPAAIETVEVRVGRLAIGSAIFEGVTAVSWDRSALYSGPDAPRGIVGFGMFRDVLLTIDYPGRQLVLESGALPSAVGGGRVVEFDAPDGVPLVPITIAGRPFAAHLDSGSMAAIMLPLAAAADLPLHSEPVVIGHGRTVNSDFEVLSATLDGDIVFGPTTVASPDVEFTKIFDHANLGSAFLSGVRLTFDQRNGRLRIEAAEPGPTRVAAPARRRTYGVMLDPRSRPLVVLNLAPGSIAERAGLRPGDVIRRIDGAPTESMLMGDLAKALRARPVTLLLDRQGTAVEITMSFDNVPGE